MTVPEGWKRQRLDRLVAKFIVPMRDKPKRFSGKTPWCRIEDIDGNTISESKLGRCVDLQTIKEMKLKVYPKGTVLCTCSCTPGICAIALNELVSNQTFIGLVPGSNMTTSSFLFYLISSMSKQLVRSSTGTTISYIPRKRFERLEVLAPPLPEQKKIDAILSSVDETIQATRETIEQTKKVKQGLMQELLTRGIGHTRFKKTEIGEIPEEWALSTLGNEIKAIKGGGTPSRKRTDFWGGTIAWATVKDLSATRLHGTIESITQEGLDSSSANLIPRDTIIIATRMAVGKPAIFSLDVAINQDLKAVFPGRSLDRDFLLQWFIWMLPHLENMGSGSTVKGLRLETLRKFKICLPSLSEQKEIAEILFSHEMGIKTAEHMLEHLQLLKKGLMQDLLTGKIRVAV